MSEGRVAMREWPEEYTGILGRVMGWEFDGKLKDHYDR